MNTLVVDTKVLAPKKNPAFLTLGFGISAFLW